MTGNWFSPGVAVNTRRSWLSQGAFSFAGSGSNRTLTKYGSSPAVKKKSSAPVNVRPSTVIDDEASRGGLAGRREGAFGRDVKCTS